MQFQMNRFFSQLVKGRFFYVVLFSNFFINCSLTSKTDCDYSGISLKLIRDIKGDNSSGAKSMMAFQDEDFWKEGGEWQRIRKEAKKVLDTLPNIDRLQTKVHLNKNSKISYALVTVILSEKSPIKNIIEVRFLHPESPLGCKIEYFNYIVLGTSNKIEVPVFSNPNSN
jgi:hypothetical protein